MRRVLRELDELKKAIGVRDLPMRAALTADDPESRVPKTYSNLVEVAQWQVRCIDALIGQFPRDIPFLKPDGKRTEVKIHNVAHAIDEIYQLQVATADDADSAVNVGLRNIVETIQTKILANQALDAAKATSTFLGYAAQPQVKEVRLSVTPAAAGVNNKLEPQEMEDFLKPSKRKYASFKCVDNQQILPMLARILEDGEIARAALYRPLKPGLKGLTGEGIKHDRKTKKVHDKRWERFVKSAEQAGLEVKVVDKKKPRGAK